MKKLVGIIGGIGVQAGLDFCQKLFDRTKQPIEQDNLSFILFNNPQIPDRTTCILNNETDKLVKSLVETCKSLEKAGCTTIVITCNTAHAVIDKVQEQIDTPIINMIEAVKDYINAIKVGLVATTGTIKSGIYQSKFDIILPSNQDEIMKDIYNIKKGEYTSKGLYDAIGELACKCDAIILGCTEIPIVIKEREYYEVPLVDPYDILISNVIQ